MSRNKQGKRVQARGNKKTKTKRKAARAENKAVTQRFVSHPDYGDIPLIPAEYRLANGRTHAYLDYDPDYRPPMPKNAVRGDVRSQSYCRMCHVPRYFHVDREQRCVQCNTDFLFSGEEQKYWYETLHFTFDSIAIRCKDCRRQRRSVKALHRQLALLLDALNDKPEDPAQLVALAEATFLLWERTGQANLNRAIAATRKAAKLWPEHAPAIYWQARCQEAAGRNTKARELLAHFCTMPDASSHKAMRRLAEAELAKRSS